MEFAVPGWAWRSARDWWEAHGGRIRAESGGQGLGTRFTFTLLAADSARDGEEAGPASSRGGSLQPESEQTRVLVVDDDPQTLKSVRDALAAPHYDTHSTVDPQEVPRLLGTHRPHVVLLDLMMPGIDGIELMGQVPELTDLPVIFISAYGRDETIARALEAGAADYIVKPFSPTELVARIQAALRQQDTVADRFVLGDLTIHFGDRRVTVGGRRVALTAKEFDLLRVLCGNAGQVATYDTLLRRVWSGREKGDRRLVRTYVKRLRGKLGDDAASPGLHRQRAPGRATVWHGLTISEPLPGPSVCRVAHGPSLDD